MSLICATIMAIAFARARNPMMVIFSATIVFSNAVDVLGGLIYNFDWDSAPEGVCYAQAMARQLAGFSFWTSGFCFTVQAYRLIAYNKRDDRFNRYCYGLIATFCVVGTMLVTIISIKTEAVKSGNYRCDIANPTWVRLMGANGVSLLLVPASTYFSLGAAYAPVNGENKPDAIVQVRDVLEGPSKIRNNNNVTRNAALRMVSFAIAYFLLNLLTSIGTVMDTIQNVPFDPRPDWSDFAGPMIAFVILLIFGTASDARRWFGEKLRNIFRK
ncbi:6162_t:CDS:2 [Paraglomus brasilianum]|uniref:6162_t:CDS:1 n=1 Tax=Paraglomus brasilianum TaxID=144538 RepID=A0A9N9F402_9GLOM|nr:6162_t:CDS:2 [Paraglomus brasilianum]